MAWWKHAQVGDKVVAIKRGKLVNPRRLSRSEIVSGEIYTVTEIVPDDTLVSGLYFRLRECPFGAYDVVLFRPVERDRTSAEVEKLRRILDQKPAPVEVRA